jgi:hypothetical protein
MAWSYEALLFARLSDDHWILRFLSLFPSASSLSTSRLLYFVLRERCKSAARIRHALALFQAASARVSGSFRFVRSVNGSNP